MTASTLKGAIKGTLKGILNTAAPVFSRRSAMDSASARETLLGFSPPPTGTAAADNRLLEPECDLQIVIPAYNVEAYLAQCMDSVLAQETKYTYRVILVDDGATGLLVPVKDATGLERAVRELMDDPARKQEMGAAAAQRARDRFDQQNQIDLTLDTYRRLLPERAPS